ncbi:MAG: hypothetical protein AAGI51_16650 [Pseudomonadota bacterium]
MRRPLLRIAAALSLLAGAAAAQPADMHEFDAQEAARGHPSPAWDHPADGNLYGGPVQGGGYRWNDGYYPGGGYWGGAGVLLGPIIINPHQGGYHRPGHHIRPGDHHIRPGLGPRPPAYRRGYRQGFRQGFRRGRRHDPRLRGHALQSRPWAPGGLYYGGSVHARTLDARRRSVSRGRRY